MATGILCHGYNLHAKGWESVVWGEPPHKLGRLPRAVLEFLTKTNVDESLIVFGTGATKKDGLFEGEYTRQYLLSDIDKLSEFEVFQKLGNPLGWKLPAILKSRTIAETTSNSTRSEISAALDIFTSVIQATEMVLVSSPTHLPRCLRDACGMLLLSVAPDIGRRYSQLLSGLRAIPSQTLHPGTVMSDVEIKEPPHIPEGSRI